LVTELQSGNGINLPTASRPLVPTDITAPRSLACELKAMVGARKILIPIVAMSEDACCLLKIEGMEGIGV
jgi:hypothetical protein